MVFFPKTLTTSLTMKGKEDKSQKRKMGGGGGRKNHLTNTPQNYEGHQKQGTFEKVSQL